MAYDLELISSPTSSVRKAAVLILALGGDLAREIFTRLSESEIRMLGEVAQRLDDVSDYEVVEVLEEFKSAFHGGTIPSAGAGSLFQIMVEGALGEERANSLLSSKRPDDPFVVCSKIEPKTLSKVLKGEHPQTTAIILSALDSSQSGKVLEHFEASLAAEVIYRMGHLGAISEDVKNDIGNTLIESLEAMGTLDGAAQVDGEQLAVDVAKALPPELSDQVLESMADTDDEFAQHIRSKLFVFDDLARLDSRTMQRLLREVDSKRLMVALKGAQEDVKTLIFTSMSSRAADMLKEDMEASPPVRIAEVQEAQDDILQVAFQLESEGAIALPRGEHSDVL